MIYQTPHRQKKDCKYRPIKKGTSPLSQIFPSHPVLHWQTNEPGVFKQVALFKQDLCKHSSTSAKRKNNHFRNHILLLHFLSIRLMFFSIWLTNCTFSSIPSWQTITGVSAHIVHHLTDSTVQARTDDTPVIYVKRLFQKL